MLGGQGLVAGPTPVGATQRGYIAIARNQLPTQVRGHEAPETAFREIDQRGGEAVPAKVRGAPDPHAVIPLRRDAVQLAVERESKLGAADIHRAVRADKEVAPANSTVCTPAIAGPWVIRSGEEHASLLRRRSPASAAACGGRA